MTSLLLELQTEELPPKALRPLSLAFASGVSESLRQHGFLSESSVVRPLASPRRLAVHISDVAPRSPAVPFRQRLMPAKIAFGADGAPTPALLKKMAALGVDRPPEALERAVEGKEEQVFWSGVKPGRELADGLRQALERGARDLPIPKVMSYQLDDGLTTVEFVRPVRHLVALHGAAVVPVEMFGLTAGRVTSGHRFHDPGELSLSDADSYVDALRRRRVLVDWDERRTRLTDGLNAVAARYRGALIAGDELIDEANSLTEWPVIYVSEFEPEFLSVPAECLILTMQANQKYFPLRDSSGKLMNRFALVSQLEATDGGREIIAGNARVVRARLADARFFYEQDCRQPLAERVAVLSNMIYYRQLGSQADRLARVRAIGREIAAAIGADPDKVDRAALLAKADLSTLMVGEFPQLQGIMGEYYARHDGEDQEVARAIREHYQPRFAGDRLPVAPISIALALADKLETLCGMFGIGLRPTGEKDPYGLRRQAVGLLRLLGERKQPLALDRLVDIGFTACAGVAGLRQAGPELLDFLYERLRVMKREAGYTAQEVDSVLCRRPPEVADIEERLAATRRFLELPEAAGLAAANKRIGNILRKVDEELPEKVDESLLREPPEKALWQALSDHEPISAAFLRNREYRTLLASLTPLEAPVNAFFDGVMVNAEDQATRRNRLALLRRLFDLMNSVAELSRLAL